MVGAEGLYFDIKDCVGILVIGSHSFSLILDAGSACSLCSVVDLVHEFKTWYFPDEAGAWYFIVCWRCILSVKALALEHRGIVRAFG